MDKLDMEKSSYGALERLIYIVLLPVLFASIMIGVLLTLFDHDIKNVVYNIGRKIPIIHYIVPETEPTGEQSANPANESIQTEQKIMDLEASGTAKDERIKQLESDLKGKDEDIEKLESSVEKLLLQQEATMADTEQYRKQLKSLADMYANMTPSRAGPILENLTMPELVLVLYEMGVDERGRVLEKINPKTAADASIQLKDISDTTRHKWEEEARAARDERNKKDDPQASVKLTNEELAQTFSAMNAGSAAAILLELNNTNTTKVITILNAMDNQSRSQILTSIAQLSSEVAASLANSLGN